MKQVRVGLNGFGRIGRAFARIAHKNPAIQITAINTAKSSSEILSYLLKYDSVYREAPFDVSFIDNSITIDRQKVKTSNEKNPEKIPWQDVDLVLDCTGVFKTREDLSKHIKGTVKKVVMSAPSKDESIPHVVLGVNDETFDFAKADIISNASCTTNCVAPMFKVLHDNLIITAGFLTTTHSYTSSQELLDDASKDFTRSRAAALSIIPSTTGAAKAVVKTIPELDGKIDGMALRVPTPVGSFSDITVTVEKSTTIEEVNSMFRLAAAGPMRGILGFEKTPLVSSDYIGNPFSCVFDANYTKVINGNFVKVFGWYDNEWGYSSRLVDLVVKLSANI